MARALQHSPRRGTAKKYRGNATVLGGGFENEPLAGTYNDYNGTESTTYSLAYRLVATLKPLERGENEEEPVYTMFGNCYHAASTSRVGDARLCLLESARTLLASSSRAFEKKKRKKKERNRAKTSARIKRMHTCSRTRTRFIVGTGVARCQRASLAFDR